MPADTSPMPQDMYAVGNDAPMLDKSQDVQLVDGYENATHTVFTFRRPLRSCDTEHDLDLGVSTVLFELIFCGHGWRIGSKAGMVESLKYVIQKLRNAIEERTAPATCI